MNVAGNVSSKLDASFGTGLRKTRPPLESLPEGRSSGHDLQASHGGAWGEARHWEVNLPRKQTQQIAYRRASPPEPLNYLTTWPTPPFPSILTRITDTGIMRAPQKRLPDENFRSVSSRGKTLDSA